MVLDQATLPAPIIDIFTIILSLIKIYIKLSLFTRFLSIKGNENKESKKIAHYFNYKPSLKEESIVNKIRYLLLVA
jgi:hypothetical protein